MDKNAIISVTVLFYQLDIHVGSVALLQRILESKLTYINVDTLV